ncbi:type VI secretion system tip protein TssI/VgrG [Sorangium sp. So ce429]
MTSVKAPGKEPSHITPSSASRAVRTAPGGTGGTVGEAAGAIASRLGGNNIELEVASDDALDVRSFSVQERLSSLFQVNLVAVSDNPSIDFDAVVGQPARFTLRAGAHDRFWSGLCSHLDQVRVEPSGLSTYQLTIVPTMWLLTQRKNYRMFQHISEPDIALKLLEEWSIVPEVRIDRGAYKKRKYRVQYGESDFAFMSRMLEDAGITYAFEQVEDETKLILSDTPHANPRRASPLMFLDDTSMARNHDVAFVTHVRMGKRVRPGKYTLRDHDYRRPPSYKLMSSASDGQGPEEKLERYQYTPGAFLFGTDQGDATPVADDKGKTRTDEKEAAILAQKRLDAKRGSAKVCTFETNAHDLAPGSVMSIAGHPHQALGESRALLVVQSSLSGTNQGEWSHDCEARGTDIPFRPELATPKPKVNGVESATVVGRAGEEIHTDEFGRVRVHFHWDRESEMDDNSSCWIHVSQSWGGAGFGGLNLPRVGQEVLVDFLGGDPDRPIIVGRVYTNLQRVPYKLPDNKTQSGWRSSSTGGGGGYNEIMFEDAQGKEHLNIQAQKDLTKLVKNNETVTIGNNRQKLVKKSEKQRIGEDQMLFVGGNVDAVVKKVKKERVEGDSHLKVKGSSKQKVEGGQSLTVVGDQQQKVGKKHALEAGKEIHIKSGDKLVIEAAQDLTIKTPGGFMRIDASGVTIKGIVVKINSGGSPGTGSGSIPEEPEDAGEPDASS